MPLNQSDVKHLGGELYRSMLSKSTVPPLTDRVPNITIDDAYNISRHYLDLRLQKNRETVVGKKIGVTSAAVQSMLGVYSPDFGFLTDAMQFSDGDVPIGQLIQPRAEAEIAFRLKKMLRGPGITTGDVLAATDSVMACFEIVDSRIENWKIKIQDTVADNASCGVFVVSDMHVDASDLDLAACKVRVYKNGKFLSEGEGSAVQGSPLASIAWLANTLGELGVALEAGELLLSGSLVPLEPIVPGDVMSMNIEGIGSLNLNFVE
ncbi:fumarylacetoacetate hydrolase family protein [Microbulbifer sp. 2205BS26-8]|uniref:fumarylacetoacetate hydrolase family protein n=1 Tax=Microbulbifer sp. 2205BS26-8 TaxID=3064386 RepID=UPI003530808B